MLEAAEFLLEPFLAPLHVDLDENLGTFQQRFLLGIGLDVLAERGERLGKSVALDDAPGAVVDAVVLGHVLAGKGFEFLDGDAELFRGGLPREATGAHLGGRGEEFALFM